MLHLELRVPDDRTQEVLDLLRHDDTVTNVAVIDACFTKPAGTLVLADVAREGANPVIAALRQMGLHHGGSIMMTEPETVLSDDATRAERAAPGDPDDGIVWDVVENRVRRDSELSVSFVVFLTLATLIAGVGRLLDQPILIIGAMVVGPEFSPVAAICVGLARPDLSLVPQGLKTLVVGFGAAVLVATPLWALAHLLGQASQTAASTGPDTNFIVHPDTWSLVVALLAGTAGVLALTTAKSGTLVGVFISVTTVPAVGTLALCIGTGVWSEIAGSLVQLGTNLVGLVVAGTATLLVQKLIWSRVDSSSRVVALRR